MLGRFASLHSTSVQLMLLLLLLLPLLLLLLLLLLLSLFVLLFCLVVPRSGEGSQQGRGWV